MAVMNSYNQNVLKFNEQKTSWENAIHLYKGPDPLEYWYHYVNWYEQNYCYDATNRMHELLQKILTQFNNINAYKQDHRMVKVWLKYVDLQPNPLKIFQNLYQRGIGTQLSFFYIAWANCYLKENDFKLAESAINWGFQAQATPLEELQSAQQQVANSYYEYTQRHHPGPYQIVIHQQSPGHPQPPLPAQVATNYHNPSYARDKRKLEDTFPVHGVHQQQQMPVKRSRPNEEFVAQYAAGGSYNNVTPHYAQATVNPKMVYHNNYVPQQQQQPQPHSQPHYVQHTVAHAENGKTHNLQQQHQGPAVVYQQPQYHNQPPQGHVYHQNGNGQEQYHQQDRHPQQPPPGQPAVQHYPQSVVYEQPCQTNSINHSNNPAMVTNGSHHNNYHSHHPQQQQHHHQNNGSAQVAATNGYSEGGGDLNNSGYVIASSLNYVYEDYHQSGLVGNGGAEVVVEQQPIEGDGGETMNGKEQGIKLPENFARGATNSHNVWRAPLFLEEPDDPNRRPMYIKEQVYPVIGTEESGRSEYEYSFEELRRNVRIAAREVINGATITEAVEEEPDAYEEYWTDDVTVQVPEDEYNGHGNVISGRMISDNTYRVQNQDQENVYYQIVNSHNKNRDFSIGTPDREFSSRFQLEPQIAKTGHRNKSSSSGKKKEKRKKMIVQINDDSDDDEEEEDGDVGGYDDGGYDETTTIRYTCDRNGLSGGSEQAGGGGDVRRITIKLRKQVATPAAAAATTKVPFRNGGGNKSNGAYGTGFYRRTATDADADLLLSLGNGQSGYYQEMKPMAAYNEDSSSYSEYNASYNSSYLGENSNSGFTSAPGTEPSTPMHSFQHHRQQGTSISATSTPHLTPAYRRLAKHRSNVSLTNEDSMCSTLNENSFVQGELDEEVKSRRLAKAVATVEEHMARECIDPFNAELCKALLTKIGFPSAELCDVYRMVQHPLPKLSNTKQALLGDTYYNVEKEVGRGTYGAVYKAANVYTGATVAIKFQKPANSWELYICNEIKKRIKYHDILPGIMDITSAVIAPNGGVLISEFSPYGSLLDINNKIRQSTTRVMHESLAMYFTSQILDIVHYLHGCRIIHADIKPDNFLIMKVPNSSSHVPTVRLIDFGCAIDMTLFPEQTQFTKVIQTEGFTCTEMRENRPWTYQTDLYCVAATAHVMLFGEYMQVAKKFGVWEIKQKLPRYLKKNVWVVFFNKLLNVPDCEDLPNLLELKATIDSEGYAMESELQKHIRTLTNLLFKR